MGKTLGFSKNELKDAQYIDSVRGRLRLVRAVTKNKILKAFEHSHTVTEIILLERKALLFRMG